MWKVRSSVLLSFSRRAMSSTDMTLAFHTRRLFHAALCRIAVILSRHLLFSSHPTHTYVRESEVFETTANLPLAKIGHFGDFGGLCSSITCWCGRISLESILVTYSTLPDVKKSNFVEAICLKTPEHAT